jgi:type IV fimbrial biogenesis protein FimT
MTFDPSAAVGPPPPPPGRVRGFTLVELVLVLAIAAILAGLALPTCRDFLADYQVRNHAERLAGNMNVARAEALKRGHRVNLCKSVDRRSCAPAGAWEDGYVVHADVDRDGDAGSVPLRVEGPAVAGVTIRANRPVADYVSYTGDGVARLVRGGLQMGTFTVCRSGRRALDVVLAHSGRVRIQRTAFVCP